MAVQAPSAAFYREGCYIDAVDSSQNWLVAFILQTDPAKGVLVRFDGWSKKWNEWLSLKSPRVAPFRRHTRLYTGQQSSAIRDWTYHREEVLGALATLEQGLDAHATAYDITQFYRGHLFMLVDNLLATPPHPEEIQVIAEFLSAVVRFAVNWTNTLSQRFAAVYQGLANPEAYLSDREVAYALIWPELFCTIERLFGCDTRLHEFLSANPPESLQLRTLNSLDVPFLLQHHFIALFADNEGFKLLWDLLKEEDLPLQIVPDFPVWRALQLLSQAFSDQYSLLTEAVLERLAKFSEKDQRNYDKFCMQQLMYRLSEVCAFGCGGAALLNQLETAEMTIALHLLKSKFLDKRVRGINNIAEGIQRLEPHLQDRFRSLTQGSMIEWLRANDVVQIILHERPHIEILKRSQPVFTFLAEKGRISQDDLDALWTSLADKHESYARTIYELLSKLASSLSRDLLVFIYKRLQTVDIARSPDYVIEGLKLFTISACNSLWRLREVMQSFCLSEFVAVLESAAESPQTAQVSTCVSELLKLDLLKNFRMQTMDRLRSAGARAAGLIGRLLGDLPDEFSRNYLQTCGASLLRDVTRWVTDAVSSNGSEKELRELLELLELVASKGSYACRLKEEDMKRLWSAFTASEGRPEAIEVFCTWLRAALIKRADFLIDSDFAVTVFKSLLCKLTEDTIETLGAGAFACFQQFFLYSNLCQQNLKYKEDQITSRYGQMLEGMDTLILFVLRTKDEAVLKQAVKFVAQLHLRITQDADIPSQFLRERIDALKKWTDEFNDQAIDRTLCLLVGLVEGHDYIRIQKHAKVCYQDWLTIYYYLSTDPTWKNIALAKHETIGTLRRTIALSHHLHADCVKLEVGQHEYTFIDDDKLLAKLPHALHFVVKHEQHEYLLQDISEILGQSDEAQDLLFQLLSRGNKPYRDKVWFLLARLPANHSIQQKIRELGVTFKAMMSSSSFHKQLFGLLALQQINRHNPTFKEVFKVHCPNALFLVLQRISRDSDLLEYFEPYDSALVLQYSQLMLQLNHAFRTREQCPLAQADVVMMVLDLLYLYAKNVLETSEMTNPSIPTAAWQTIMEYVDETDFEGLRSLLVKFKHFDKLIFHSLQRAKNGYFSNQMKMFFQQASLPPLNLLPILSEKLVNVSLEAVESTETTRAYFSLTSKLIKQQAEASNEEYFGELFRFLKRRAPEPHPKAEDRGLTGALKLMRAMVAKTPSFASQEVAEYVLLTCLIDFEETHESQSEKPKCKSPMSRLAGFKLLGTLALSPPMREYVLEVLSNFHRDTSWRKARLLCWLNAYNSFEKSATGFVGLRNLGCTCYMNSMLQQLFMIPTFRQGLFQCESTGEPEESVLFQLQKIMAGLERSDKMFVQARGLCNAYINWEGQPINPNEQIDVDEFFNGLMDRVEENLKPTGRSKLVEEHFRGILTTQCIGKGNCSHCSERDEPFMTLPLEIKNKRSITDSLEALIAGETLEGDNAYACDYCAAKVTARRRLCIRSLPNFLILTLRRFDFDMDTMNRIKLNNYCEFPLSLDMKPYTLEAVMLKDALQAQEEARAQGRDTSPLPEGVGIPSDYFQYNLRGVIIHLGLAEAGHYYSYILDTKTGKWVEFNDSNVEEFNIENLPKEAFGAAEKPMAGMQGEEAGKMRNAYVLLYERTVKYQLKGKDDQMPSLQELPTEVQPAPSVQQLLEKVHKSNQRYWRKRRVFSPEYSHFVQSLTAHADPSVLQFIVRHYFTAQIRSKEYSPQLMRFLYDKAPEDNSMAVWILEMLSYEPMLKELYFDCPISEAKKFATAVADKCLRRVDEEEHKRFLKRLLLVLRKLPGKLTTQHAGYFELIYRVVLLRPDLADELDLCRNLLAAVFGHATPVEAPLGEIVDVSLGRADEDFVDTLPASPGSQALSYSFQIATVDKCLERLAEDLIEGLKSPETIALLVKGANGRLGANHMSHLYRSLIQRDPSVFPEYLQTLLSEIKENDYDQHKSPLIQIKRLIAANEHTAQIMKEVLQILISNMVYIRATESLINFLYKLVWRFPAVRAWMAANSQPLMGLNAWRQKYLIWNNQSTNGLYLTKVYNPHSQFMDYHPSTIVSNRVTVLLSGKVPEIDRDIDSDDDLYEEPLQTKSSAEFLYKEEICYKVEVCESFQTLYYLKFESMEQLAPIFIGADDDRLMRQGTRHKSVVLK